MQGEHVLLNELFLPGSLCFLPLVFPFACFDYLSPELFISAISPVFDFLVNKVGVELMLTTELGNVAVGPVQIGEGFPFTFFLARMSFHSSLESLSAAFLVSAMRLRTVTGSSPCALAILATQLNFRPSIMTVGKSPAAASLNRKPLYRPEDPEQVAHGTRLLVLT